MKLYAQVGYGLGDKVIDALNDKLIDGAIFSPKDSGPGKLPGIIESTRDQCSNAELLLDPQFYASLRAETPNAKLGKLPDWDYFQPMRKGQLEVSKDIDKVLHGYFEGVKELPLSGVIAPNIYISQSLDSREAVIAKNFIRQARDAYDKSGGKLPLYGTLAICREALLDQREFEEFLNDLTVMDNPPDGFYVIIGSRSSELRSDVYHSDVISNWMLLNMSLKVNGFKVINGYSDTISPLLGAVGADGGATGWWQNLRMFSMDKFFPQPGGGGRLPVMRYLSKALLNRITFFEKEQAEYFIPEVANGLPLDAEYAPEPERKREVMQSWEALGSLIKDIVVEDDIETSLANCVDAVAKAEATYAELSAEGISLVKKSSDEHLEAMREGIEIFMDRAEI